MSEPFIPPDGRVVTRSSENRAKVAVYGQLARGLLGTISGAAVGRGDDEGPDGAWAAFTCAIMLSKSGPGMDCLGLLGSAAADRGESKVGPSTPDSPASATMGSTMRRASISFSSFLISSSLLRSRVRNAS